LKLTFFFRWTIFAIGVVAMLGTVAASWGAPAAPQAASLVLQSPAACPVSGCAAGQSLNVRADYDLTGYDPTLSDNVQVCLYTPINWSANSFNLATVGGVTAKTYTPSITYCQAAPANYTLLGGGLASLDQSYFGDSLGLGFRLGNTAFSNGSLLVRVYERLPGDTWSMTQQAFLAIPVTGLTTTVYVANDAATCGLYAPCYINSGNDAPGGFGTGLKDAVDAQIAPAVISVLGNYLLKSYAVQINRPTVLQGLNDASIQPGGLTCSEPLLRVSDAVTIQNLTLSSAACPSTRRDLIEVQSAAAVTIRNNDLINGGHAVHVLAGDGNVTLLFNHVQGNSGYALLRETGGAGQVNLIANNLLGNRLGAQVDCAGLGRADHNFWGSGVSAAMGANNCITVEGKRLGASMVRRDGAAGVKGERLTVQTVKQYTQDGGLGLYRVGSGADFDVFAVSHGAGSVVNVPFTGGSPDDLTPCSEYWDVFLADETAPVDQSLVMSLKYDRSSGCIASVESSEYCGGTDATLYPLWWYDPANGVTAGWDTTGQNPAGPGAGGATGQQTTCLLAQDEIEVVLDDNGRPGLGNDLTFTPFVVGLPPRPSGVVITRFVGIAGNTQAAIQWTTSSEVNILGFFVQRSLVADSGFVDVSSLIPRQGSGVSGANYEYVDTGLTNGTVYYYRLRVQATDLSSTFTGSISVLPGLPTATPTATSTVTATETATLTATQTQTPTITGTLPTSTATVTRTLTPTITGTPPTATLTRTATVAPTRTRTRTPAPSATQRLRSPTSVAKSRTPTPLTGTPDTATPVTSTLPGGTLTPGGPTVGYPVDVTQSPGGEGTPGYPAGAETATPTQELGSATALSRGEIATRTQAARRTSLAQTGTPSVDQTPTEKRTTWLVPLLIIWLGVALLAGLGYYLWKQGLLVLPLQRRSAQEEPLPEQDDETSSSANQDDGTFAG
jgi:hypothetical protein